MNTIKIALVIISMIISVKVYSQTEKPQAMSPSMAKNHYIPQTQINFQQSFTTRPYYQSKQYTWYLTIDIKSIRQHDILGSLTNFNLSEQFTLQLDKLPKELDGIFIYGNSLKRSGEVTAYLHGDLSDSIFEHYIENIMHTKNGKSQLKKLKKRIISGTEYLIFEHKNSNQKLYAKKLKNGIFVISNRITYTKYTVHKGDKNSKENPSVTDLLVLNIDAEMARKNMQLNLNKDGYIMQSQLFAKAKNIVAKIQLIGENVIIGSALTTNNEQIAIQIEKILEGITAYNSLTNAENANTLKSILMNNMVIERKEKNVHLGTYIPLDRITTIK